MINKRKKQVTSRWRRAFIRGEYQYLEPFYGEMWSVDRFRYRFNSQKRQYFWNIRVFLFLFQLQLFKLHPHPIGLPYNCQRTSLSLFVTPYGLNYQLAESGILIVLPRKYAVVSVSQNYFGGGMYDEVSHNMSRYCLPVLVSQRRMQVSSIFAYGTHQRRNFHFFVEGYLREYQIILCK